MKPQMLKALDNFPVVMEYLKGIPRQLWELVLPEQVSDLQDFSSTIELWQAREAQRNHIIGLQRKYGLKFRPNASMHETMKLVRLRRMERKRRKKNNNNQRFLRFDENGNIPTDPDEDLME